MSPTAKIYENKQSLFNFNKKLKRNDDIKKNWKIYISNHSYDPEQNHIKLKFIKNCQVV